MEYREAIHRFGSDKPDPRFGMELCDVTQHFAAGREKLRIEGHVQAFAATGASAFSRKQLDELAEQAKKLGARGLYTMKVAAEGVTSSLDKTLGAPAIAAIVAATGAKPGDLIVAVSAAEQIPGNDAAALIAGQLRLSLAEKLSLIPKDRWEFLWLTGFPLFEWSSSEKRWAPAQHPFTGIVGKTSTARISAAEVCSGLRSGIERREPAGQHPNLQPGIASAFRAARSDEQKRRERRFSSTR
jgi:aspartyl-tRNA synthetase